LKHPDRIDKMDTGLHNLLQRLVFHGRLYHCFSCRLQFYDRRSVADAAAAAPFDK
jgi:hypothetical protein